MSINSLRKRSLSYSDSAVWRMRCSLSVLRREISSLSHVRRRRTSLGVMARMLASCLASEYWSSRDIMSCFARVVVWLRAAMLSAHSSRAVACCLIWVSMDSAMVMSGISVIETECGRCGACGVFLITAVSGWLI